MSDTFDWAGLWQGAEAAKHDCMFCDCDAPNEAAAAYLRTRIEAAFVPRDSLEFSGTLLLCKMRDEIAEATARAEAAEARVKALLESIGILETALKAIAGSHWERWGMDQTDFDEVPDHSGEEAMEIARAALGGEYVG